MHWSLGICTIIPHAKIYRYAYTLKECALPGYDLVKEFKVGRKHLVILTYVLDIDKLSAS